MMWQAHQETIASMRLQEQGHNRLMKECITENKQFPLPDKIIKKSKMPTWKSEGKITVFFIGEIKSWVTGKEIFSTVLWIYLLASVGTLSSPVSDLGSSWAA